MCSGTHLGTATIAPGGLRLYTARWCNHRLWTSDCTRCTVWAIKPSSPGDASGTATQGAMVGALPGGRTERKWATLCSCLLCTVTLSGWGQRLPAHLLPKKEKEGKEVQTKELQYHFYLWRAFLPGCDKRNRQWLKANGISQLLQPEETRICSLLFLIWSSILINNESD